MNDGSPYRAGDHDEREPIEQSGLVADLIRQFADPLAFYRELVQNAIDAGATSIIARAIWEPSADATRGVMRISVEDDGSGMTREILEEDLVVLFRSTKESRDDAIGKFGVGFVSVLGVSPDAVIIDTSTGDGVRWSMHLHPDQSYDLFRAEGASAKGTTVTLHVPLEDSARAEFVLRSEAALKRWCRHTRVPIRWVVIEPGRSEALRDVRIDEPLGLSALLSVQAQSSDGLTVAIVGLPQPESHGSRGYYNRGLLLYETSDFDPNGIVFKVIDPRIEHTLSRDDVRRDANYDRVQAFVGDVISRALIPEIAIQLARAADAHARGSQDAGRRFFDIARAVHRARLELHANHANVPLLGSDERKSAAISALRDPCHCFRAEYALTKALVDSGRDVIDLSFLEDDADRMEAVAWISGLRGAAVPREDEAWSYIEPIEPSEHDRALLDHTADLLGKVARAPSALVLGRIYGALQGALAIAAPRRPAPWLIPASSQDDDPFRWIARPPLLLSAEHPIVIAARKRTDALPLASTLLVRAILVSRSALDPKLDERLTVLGVERAQQDAQ